MGNVFAFPLKMFIKNCKSLKSLVKNLSHYSIKYYITLFYLLWLTPFFGQYATPETAIKKAFQESQLQKTQTPLQALNITLEKACQSEYNSFNRYWYSYGLYNQALIADELDDKEAAEQLVDRAIELLESLREDAESQALLALELGYSTRFKSYWSMISLGRNAYQRAELAVALAPANLRTNLSLAITDFFTPKVFGGGKKVESLLLSALHAPRPSASDITPQWGKPNVYELFVKYYRKNNQPSKAQKYLNEGLREFPKNKLLLALK